MNIKNKEDIIQLIQADEWMMDVLKTAQTLHLPDWWICAGFVRSKIWDELHGYKQRTSTPDIDFIYFDESNLDEAVEKKLEDQLRSINPSLPWSVKNEARMHLIDHTAPYSSSIDAISKFPETATALGVSLDEQQQIIFTAPCGIDDVISMRVCPTPIFKETEQRMRVYEARVKKKNWIAKWPKIKVSSIIVTDEPSLQQENQR
ncbi:hypothetical protein FHS15_000791 [Paenibacillus castaneae]|uniref:nucleotidyltransferase family protein n=1 Tax=Paenibacillus castaneae TaxID=474957 RepID=UPI000C9B514E|nr:nucleotidyltransferase family protein [Paenibacillus castaneae]NIK75691.1 hypothetical protein [Paenibacillus castaneae]